MSTPTPSKSTSIASKLSPYYTPLAFVNLVATIGLFGMPLSDMSSEPIYWWILYGALIIQNIVAFIYRNTYGALILTPTVIIYAVIMAIFIWVVISSSPNPESILMTVY
jgi:hypothetical protein